MFACLLAASLLAIGSPRIVLQKLGLVALDQRPSAEDLLCGNYSDEEWSVSVAGGKLKVKRGANSPQPDPLPFEVPGGEDRIGRRHIARVTDGWLVGFDAGEFGGGLWWHSSDGRGSVHVSPSTDGPAHPNDVHRAENVLGFVRMRGELLVLMGLDHGSSRSGRVFRSVKRDNHWALASVAVLDARPAAWTIDGSRLLVLTESGLWAVTVDMGATQIHRSDTTDQPAFPHLAALALLYPNSLVRGPDGALYAGMRRYVLRFEPLGDQWTETWLVSKDCVRVRIVGLECQCLP